MLNNKQDYPSYSESNTMKGGQERKWKYTGTDSRRGSKCGIGGEEGWNERQYKKRLTILEGKKENKGREEWKANRG